MTVTLVTGRPSRASVADFEQSVQFSVLFLSATNIWLLI